VLTAGEIGQNAPTPTGLTQTAFDLRTTIGPPARPAGDRSCALHRRLRPGSADHLGGGRSGPVRATRRLHCRRHGGAIAVTATVTVIREGEITIDLSKTTGKFHGGAAGSLYGLYGDGVPTNNLIEGMHLRTVSTKAQDGPQHPGADALEVAGRSPTAPAGTSTST
jgi:hypothetical protein